MGKGSKLFFAKPGGNQNWKEFADLSSAGIKTITRIAISPSGKQIALVADD